MSLRAESRPTFELVLCHPENHHFPYPMQDIAKTIKLVQQVQFEWKENKMWHNSPPTTFSGNQFALCGRWFSDVMKP
jgi:hypothetical protein